VGRWTVRLNIIGLFTRALAGALEEHQDAPRATGDPVQSSWTNGPVKLDERSSQAGRTVQSSPVQSRLAAPPLRYGMLRDARGMNTGKTIRCERRSSTDGGSGGKTKVWLCPPQLSSESLGWLPFINYGIVNFYYPMSLSLTSNIFTISHIFLCSQKENPCVK